MNDFEGQEFIRSPHHRLQGRELFFLKSSTQTGILSEGEVDLWNLLATRCSKETILGCFGYWPVNEISKFLDKRYCYAIPKAIQNRDRRILVFEPHCDDAALSVGASLYDLHRDYNITIVTLGGNSNYTSNFLAGKKDFFVRGEVTKIRESEGEIFAAALAGSYKSLNLNEATLRYSDDDWELEWFRSHKICVTACTNHLADENTFNKWFEAVTHQILSAKPNEVWFPLGIGFHSDHELARNSVLRFMERHAASTPEIVFKAYTDVPYAVKFPHHFSQITDQLSLMGFRFSREDVNIDRSFAKKEEMLSVFASQFKVSAIIDGVQKSAKFLSQSHARRAETLFTFSKSGTVDQFWKLHPSFTVLKSFHRNYRKLLRKRYKVDRINIFLIMPSGDINQDLKSIGRAFPNAFITIFTTHASHPEVENLSSDRGYKVIHIGRGWKAWSKCLLFLFLPIRGVSFFALSNKFYSLRKFLFPLQFSVSHFAAPTLDDIIRTLDGTLYRESSKI